MQLAIENLSKSYGKKQVLKNINVDFSPGVYGILGANGSGKTTLMRLLATVSKPDAGKIALDGEDIFIMEHRYRSLLGYLPQEIGLYKHFTAEKFLRYIAVLKGMDKIEAKAKTREVLEFVGMEKQGKQKTGKMSGGMKQRIGIAQALLNDPKILIVDEPTAGLDPKERIRFRNLLSMIASDRIVLLSTHIVSDLEFIARDILIMKEGELIRKSTQSSLLDSIKGKVWTLKVTPRELPSYQKQYKIGSMVNDGEQVTIRVIAEQQPEAHAASVIPNLEDLYLYYFGEEAV